MSKDETKTLKTYSDLKEDGIFTPKELWSQFRIVPTLELVETPNKNGALTLVIHTAKGYEDISQQADKDTLLVLEKEGYRFAHRNSALAQRLDVIVLDPHSLAKGLPLRKANAQLQEIVQSRLDNGVFDRTHKEHLRVAEYKAAKAQIEENITKANSNINRVLEENAKLRDPAIAAALESKIAGNFREGTSAFSNLDKYSEFAKQNPGELESLNSFMAPLSHNPENNKAQEIRLEAIEKTLQPMGKVLEDAKPKLVEIDEGDFKVAFDETSLKIIHGEDWEKIKNESSSRLLPDIPSVGGEKKASDLVKYPVFIEELEAGEWDLTGSDELEIDEIIGPDALSESSPDSTESSEIKSDTKKKVTTGHAAIQKESEKSLAFFQSKTFDEKKPQISIELTPEIMAEARLAYFFKLTADDQIEQIEKGFQTNVFDDKILLLMEKDEQIHNENASKMIEDYLSQTAFNAISEASFNAYYSEVMQDAISFAPVADAEVKYIFIEFFANPVGELEDTVSNAMRHYLQEHGRNNFSVSKFSEYFNNTEQDSNLDQPWMQEAWKQAVEKNIVDHNLTPEVMPDIGSPELSIDLPDVDLNDSSSGSGWVNVADMEFEQEH